MVIALAIMQHGSVIEDIGCLVVKDIYQDPEDRCAHPNNFVRRQPQPLKYDLAPRPWRLTENAC